MFTGRTPAPATLPPVLALAARAHARPLVLLVLAAGLLGAAATTWRDFVDLDVYRFGGRVVLDGLPLYGVAHPDSGLLFTYPPFAALLMTVMALPPAALTVGLWTGLGVAALALTVRVFAVEVGHRPTPGLLALVTVGMLALDPVRETLEFGQVNLVLMALVSYDLLAHRGRWVGVLVGVAAGIKLTPLVFVVLLYALGRRSDAVRATLAFAGTVLVGFLVVPRSASAYWLEAIWDSERVGNLEYVRNQALSGTLTRLTQHEPSTGVWLVVAGAAGATLLALAVAWWRRGARDVGVLLAAGAMLLCSPISWDHHFVWIAPLLVVLAVRGPRWAAMGVAAVGVVGARVLVPRGSGRELTWGWLDQLAGNGFTWLVLLLACVAAQPLVAGRTRPTTSPSVSLPPEVEGAEYLRTTSSPSRRNDRSWPPAMNG